MRCLGAKKSGASATFSGPNTSSVAFTQHSYYGIYFLAQSPGALPKSLQFVETDCQAGNTLDLGEWYFDTGARQQ